MSEPAPALEAAGLGKRYGRKWALEDCTFRVPTGRIAALVGPNGAGKSTLLRMAAGITRPTAGDVRVFGQSPQRQTVAVLRQIGYLDQERPLYRSFRVDEMLRFGEKLNPDWYDATARSYLDALEIPVTSKVGKLSVGQQAQVALTMCLAKRPALLLLDEPVAALDPVAREGVMHILLRSVVDDNATVVLSSHAVADLATICDYVIILSAARVYVADDLDYVLASHRLLMASSEQAPSLPPGVVVVSTRSSERQTSLLVRVEQPVTDPAWRVVEPTLEEIVIAYLREKDLRNVAFGGPRDGGLAEDVR
ncbi:MAG: ABC transporter ATP-binding protein [Acidimicrobiales bacterium]